MSLDPKCSCKDQFSRESVGVSLDDRDDQEVHYIY